MSPSHSEISVFVTYHTIDHIKATLFVEVIDSGPGIDPADKNSLFKPFSAKVGGGQGLGLYLSQRIARRLGGNIEFVDIEPPGAMFIFTSEIKIPLFGQP